MNAAIFGNFETISAKLFVRKRKWINSKVNYAVKANKFISYKFFGVGLILIKRLI